MKLIMTRYERLDLARRLLGEASSSIVLAYDGYDTMPDDMREIANAIDDLASRLDYANPPE